MNNIRFKLEQQLLGLQAKNGRRYTYSQIAEATGQKRQTFERIARNESYQDLLTTMSALLSFFTAEGMPITVGDLFEVVEDDQSSS